MTRHNYPTHGLKDKRYHLAYAYLLEKQNGLCLICNRHQSNVIKKFCIDHCHVTGKIRGLLCEGCNHMIGNVENEGCAALGTKLPMEELNKNLREEFYLRVEMDAAFKRQVERGKIMHLTFTQESYDRHHRHIDEWMDKQKDAVLRYLSLPGLNDEIEAYCNQFMRPRRTAMRLNV